MSRVLVVEDEANIADYLVRGLREEGFVAEAATDGIAAWQQLRGGSWDLVLLDWWLPGRDGLEILKRFRELDRRTPVLFLTARARVQERILGLDSGADDYLCKPFDFDELLARVRALLRRREDGTVLTHGDLTVDLTSQRAERACRPLDLTSKEYTLLVYFLRHHDQVLTRTQLYKHVWDESYEGISNTLEAHILELRRKLEVYGGRLIHTRRGQGYIFESPPHAEGGEAR
jgi:DNA-binding response OmpR family regulator